MAFTANGPRPWPLPPDWSEGVRETLRWETEVLRAVSTASSQHRAILETPLRSFELRFIEEGDGQRVLDALLNFAGGNTFLLPIFPDVQYLGQAVSIGAEWIDCRTEGFDFTPSGKALLWRQPNVWEVVDIETVEELGVTLAAPVASTWPIGTRLYPLRKAFARAGAEDALYHDDASSATVSFSICEPCLWPESAPANSYRGFPVLEWVPDEGERRTSGYTRALLDAEEIAGSAPPLDLAGVALPERTHRFLLHGRTEQASFRALLYWLRGRASPVWRPSWRSDVKLHATVAADSTLMVVRWSGYALWSKEAVGRRDIRIALKSGLVMYRRVLDAVQFGEVEHLTLSSPLAEEIGPADVLMISFLSLCTLASDAIEIEHSADAEGMAVVTTGFAGVLDDV